MNGKRIISYLKAGYLLHIITISEILLFLLVLSLSAVESWISGVPIFIKLIVLSPIVGMPLFAQLDARSRYQNYKLIKDNLYLHGFQKRILKPFVKSRCQRDAIRAAAEELGMLQVCSEYFKTSGYRWYHLLPDVIFNSPSILRTKNFWTTTLFEKTYHPKIDYEKAKALVLAGETR
ncbi:MAG TPA: hypothetical protein VGI82_13425 [Chitinophagaceae bacterium]|jgi:hypothetical protein